MLRSADGGRTSVVQLASLFVGFGSVALVVDTWTVVVTWAELSAGLGSRSLELPTAVFVIVAPGWVEDGTATTRVTLAAAVALRGPVQLMSPPAIGQLQPGVLVASIDTKLVPAGIESLTSVSVTSGGPWLVAEVVFVV